MTTFIWPPCLHLVLWTTWWHPTIQLTSDNGLTLFWPPSWDLYDHYNDLSFVWFWDLWPLADLNIYIFWSWPWFLHLMVRSVFDPGAYIWHFFYLDKYIWWMMRSGLNLTLMLIHIWWIMISDLNLTLILTSDEWWGLTLIWPWYLHIWWMMRSDLYLTLILTSDSEVCPWWPSSSFVACLHNILICIFSKHIIDNQYVCVSLLRHFIFVTLD